ncbi:hypothetical protein H4Q26_018030 [Puccinia striiformis f. sp. tritici PST-130]|nr:hypothetical protein H4Q26_018030 [Puccinia striiformis f. sp. tritici PST-130]
MQLSTVVVYLAAICSFATADRKLINFDCKDASYPDAICKIKADPLTGAPETHENAGPNTAKVPGEPAWTCRGGLGIGECCPSGYRNAIHFGARRNSGVSAIAIRLLRDYDRIITATQQN